MKSFFVLVCVIMIAAGMMGCGENAADNIADNDKEPVSEAVTYKVEAETASDEENSDEKASDEEASDEENFDEENFDEEATEKTQVQVFIAASLSNVMEKVAEKYNETHPDVELVFNANGSGALMTQIEEGFSCDIFFSAAQKQMDELEEKGFLAEGSRKDVLNNQVAVITYKGSDSLVTGLSDMKKAKSIALADGSVPVGKYTRQAMVNAGIVPETEDVSKITTDEVSGALGGVEISELDNVSKVLNAVAEGSCEVGTVYCSDMYGYEDKVEVLEVLPYELTGKVIYPAAQVKNDDADEAEMAAAKEFLDYITGDEAKEIFTAYGFDTGV